jgi:hypothetical protein
MTNHSIFTCECCGSDYLINFKTRTFEPLFDEQVEFDDELGFSDDDATHELDLDGDLYEEEITAEPEPTIRRNTGADVPHLNDSYETGVAFVPGKDRTDENGRVVRENVPVTNSGKSRLVVETQMKQGNKPNPTVRQRKKKGQMEQLGPMKNVVRPPKKKVQQMNDGDLARDGFESYGDDASQDFTGLTGQEAHFDNLLQSAYEADLDSRNIPY